MCFRIFKVFVFCSFFFTTMIAFAQVTAQKVGQNPGNINGSAAFEIESSTKGLLPPRMSESDRNAIVLPATGLIIYNTISNMLEINAGSPTLPDWKGAGQLNLSGDVTSAGAAVTVKKINGVTMSDLATGIVKNTTATGVPGIAVVRLDYAEPTAGLPTGILKNTTGSGAHSIAIASDFPILNQNTTGNAATVTTNANLNGMVTSIGNKTTVVTNANLTGEATSVGNAVTLDNSAVISKKLTAYSSASGIVGDTDSILQAIQKLDGNDALPGIVKVFTSNGTYTPVSTVKWITVEGVGGGGGGGSIPITSGNCAASGGGGAGGYRKVLIPRTELLSFGSSFSVSIGAGGSAGGVGGTSSFGSSISFVGGAAGASSAATANGVVANGGNGGNSTSSIGNVIYSLNGQNGEAGYATTASSTRFFKGGNGGNSFLGFGGICNIAVAKNNTPGSTNAPVMYGGGGAGIANTNGNARTGQAGAGGVVIITEFF